MTKPTIAGPDWGFVATGLAFIAIVGANLVDIRRGQIAIRTERAAQIKVITEARRAEGQLYALARGTQLLADKGNANAAEIAGVLRQNGISFTPETPGR